MSWPTDIETIEKNVLDSLNELKKKLRDVQSARNLKARRKALSSWCVSYARVLDCCFNPLPRRIKQSLRFVENPELISIRVQRSEHEALENVCGPSGTTCTVSSKSKPCFPKLDTEIKKAEAVFRDLKDERVVDFTPKLADIEAIILDVLKPYSKTWAERTEDETEKPARRKVANGIARHKPLRGLTTRDLVDRVESEERVATEPMIHAAIDRLRQSGRIEEVLVPKFKDGIAQSKLRKVWIIADKRDGWSQSARNYSAAEKNNIVLHELREAIKQTRDGKTAKPEVILRKAHVSEKKGREGLRQLEKLNEYAGFTRPMPARYRR